jgi:hypothetical protein
MKLLITVFVLLFAISAKTQVKQRENQVVSPAVQVTQRAKFVLTCNETNLSGLFQPVVNYVPGNHYSEVIINHRLCNNNPNAFILVTPITLKPFPFTLAYDNSLERWKIKIETNGVSESHTGYATPADKNPTAVTVLDYSPNFLRVGDKFNILIDNE